MAFWLSERILFLGAPSWRFSSLGKKQIPGSGWSVSKFGCFSEDSVCCAGFCLSWWGNLLLWIWFCTWKRKLGFQISSVVGSIRLKSAIEMEEGIIIMCPYPGAVKIVAFIFKHWSKRPFPALSNNTMWVFHSKIKCQPGSWWGRTQNKPRKNWARFDLKGSEIELKFTTEVSFPWRLSCHLSFFLSLLLLQYESTNMGLKVNRLHRKSASSLIWFPFQGKTDPPLPKQIPSFQKGIYKTWEFQKVQGSDGYEKTEVFLVVS